MFFERSKKVDLQCFTQYKHDMYTLVTRNFFSCFFHEKMPAVTALWKGLHPDRDWTLTWEKSFLKMSKFILSSTRRNSNGQVQSEKFNDTCSGMTFQAQIFVRKAGLETFNYRFLPLKNVKIGLFIFVLFCFCFSLHFQRKKSNKFPQTFPTYS